MKKSWWDRCPEYCCECGSPTGKAGASEDSMYIEDEGPFCEECYDNALAQRNEDNGQFGVGA